MAFGQTLVGHGIFCRRHLQGWGVPGRRTNEGGGGRLVPEWSGGRPAWPGRATGVVQWWRQLGKEQIQSRGRDGVRKTQASGGVLSGPGVSKAYVWSSGLPQTSPGFAFGLREFGRTDSSTNVCGAPLDGKNGSDPSVQTFAAVLWHGVGDALTHVCIPGPMLEVSPI